jgi:hypothetical protein
MSPNAGEGREGVAGSQPKSRAVHRSQINFGDLTPYLTYGQEVTYSLEHLQAPMTIGGSVCTVQNALSVLFFCLRKRLSCCKYPKSCYVYGTELGQAEPVPARGTIIMTNINPQLR